MKNLILYENFKQYSVGDYIQLKIDRETPWTVELNSKIIYIKKLINNKFHYEVETFRLPNQKSFNNKPLKDNELISFFIREYDIERKLTPEEIEKFEIKKISRKYNL